jgi:hypothetical protein
VTGPHHPYPLVELVRRPPRPRAVPVAVALTWSGVALSGLLALVSAGMTIRYGGGALPAAVTDRVAASDGLSRFVSVATVVTVVLDLVFAAAVSVVLGICAVLTGRGRDAARVVLAVAAGLIACYQGCGGLVGLGVRALAPAGGPGAAAPGAWDAWQRAASALDLVLAGLAAVISILLLLPRVNRFFRPGAGREFDGYR